jgi:hypothetical protein
MSELPSPNAIIRRLVELSLLLDKATTEVDQLDDAAVQAKGANRVAYARAFLNATGPMDVRKETAVVETEEQWFAYEVAEQKVRACKERIRTLREQIEIARSLSAALRSEWAAS